jgi:hypothetical protein
MRKDLILDVVDADQTGPHAYGRHERDLAEPQCLRTGALAAVPSISPLVIRVPSWREAPVILVGLTPGRYHIWGFPLWTRLCCRLELRI